MRNFGLILFFHFVLLLSAMGQEAEEDSVWNLEDLDYGELEEPKPKSIEESHGWFPKSTVGLGQFGFIPAYMGDNFDVANNIRSESFVKTTNSFSGKIFLNDDERAIKKKNSKDFYESSWLPVPILGKLFESPTFPVTVHGGIGFDLTYSPELPVNYYGKLVTTINSSLLFSKEPIKHYIDIHGNSKPFTEASIINLIEWSINSGLGLEIPIYGAFLKVGEMSVHSYYYLSFGPSVDFIIWSSAMQYMQIADAKKDLRYNNGQDTLELINGIALPNLNRIRVGIDVNVGWNFSAGPVGLGLELFSYIPIRSVIDDAIWKQYRFGFRYKILFSGISK
ncbi:MAG: hypothetical protein V1779_12515 [bacterium]